MLVSDRLDRVVSAILLGRASHAKMRQNIAIAVAFNALGIALAIAGRITTPIAIGIIIASVIAVLLSTLSLLRLQLGESAGEAPAGAPCAGETVVDAIIPARRMHCASCARSINDTLSRVEGVRAVAADATRKEVLVSFEPARVTEDRLRDELVGMGFR